MSLFSLRGFFDFSSISHYLGLFLYTIGHDYTGIAHLLGNLTFILLIGPIVEEKYGSKKLLIMMAITALATAILYILIFDEGLVGASGIVFMLIILVSFTNVKQGGIPLTFILVFVLFVGQEIYNIFDQDNVSQFAHIAGGIIGGLFGFMRYFAPQGEHQQKASTNRISELNLD